MVTFGCPEYPERLKEIYDPPPVLWLRGPASLLSRPGIAIVGTRHPSPYGSGVAEMLARDLAARRLLIISGMARGIDTCAHRGALAARCLLYTSNPLGAEAGRQGQRQPGQPVLVERRRRGANRVMGCSLGRILGRILGLSLGRVLGQRAHGRSPRRGSRGENRTGRFSSQETKSHSPW